MKKLLVLGVGNILLTDEGIGVKAVYEFLKEKWPENVDFIDGGTFTQDMYDLFRNYENVLVLDVVRGGKPPGTMYLFNERELIDDQDQSLSLHDIDLLDSLQMAEMLGNRPVLKVVGIEPESLDWSMELTETLQNRFPLYVETARKEILSILES